MTLKFDTTINVSNVVAVVLVLAASLGGFYSQGSRITVLEDRDTRTQLAAAERLSESKETLRDIRADIKELQRGVNAIGLAVAGKVPSVVNNQGSGR